MTRIVIADADETASRQKLVIVKQRSINRKDDVRYLLIQGTAGPEVGTAQSHGPRYGRQLPLCTGFSRYLRSAAGAVRASVASLLGSGTSSRVCLFGEALGPDLHIAFGPLYERTYR